MTDPERIAEDYYDRALTERILKQPDSYFTLDPCHALAAKVGVSSVVLTRADTGGPGVDHAVLVPGHRIPQLVDWLTDVRDGCIEPATVGEERW